MIAYFPPSRFFSSRDAQALLQSLVANHGAVEVDHVPARDWGTEWRKNFKPVRIGRRIVVCPSWEPYRRRRGDLVITIDPKMSFGTGTHESTQLALRLMEPVVRRGHYVLDIGTGTAILAIAAVRLGAAKAYGLDVDASSIGNARENRRVNGCGRTIVLHEGTLESRPACWPQRYDLVLANIQRSVIVELLPMIASVLEPDGDVVVSGILAEESSMMQAALDRGSWRIAARRNKGEWIAYRLRKNP